MKYERWLREWFCNYVEPSVKTRTKELYRAIIEKRLVPRFGGMEMEEITPQAVQRYVTELLRSGNFLTGRGLSSNSVNGVLTVMRSSLRLAHLLGEADEYTADRVKRPKKTEREVTCFTLSEQKNIEQAAIADGRAKTLGVVLCLYSGLRIGELLALRWSDVDFEAGTLTVSRSCHDGKNDSGRWVRMVEEPKTTSSKRVIPLPRGILELLYGIKNRGLGEEVICNENGSGVCVRSYQNSFRLLLRRAGVRIMGFHSLRHTFATRALECNMDVKTLSEILGHKSATVTLNRYAHSMMEHKVDMMNRLGDLL